MVKTLPSKAGGVGLIPGWEANIPHASWPKNQNIRQKQYCTNLRFYNSESHSVGVAFNPSQNTGVDSHSLLQGIFPTQGSNLGLLHCRQIFYCLSLLSKVPVGRALDQT